MAGAKGQFLEFCLHSFFAAPGDRAFITFDQYTALHYQLVKHVKLASVDRPLSQPTIWKQIRPWHPCCASIPQEKAPLLGQFQICLCSLHPLALTVPSRTCLVLGVLLPIKTLSSVYSECTSINCSGRLLEPHSMQVRLTKALYHSSEDFCAHHHLARPRTMPSLRPSYICCSLESKCWV